jgi:23S rRNA pseudouridine1911/1915/1917 synthase
LFVSLRVMYRHINTEEYSDIQSRILFEDNHFIIFNKRAGEIVQGDKTGDECLSETLKAFVAQRDSKPGAVYMGVPHRLDRPVSGAVIFAKTSKGLERINDMLRKGLVHKTYWALVCARPQKDEAELVNYLTRNEKQNKSYVLPESQVAKLCLASKSAGNRATVDSSANPFVDDSSNLSGNKAIAVACKNAGSIGFHGATYKEARLKYKLIKVTDRYFLLEVQLLTGRHHQIRAQLSAIGCPIKGDLKYGSPRSNKDGSISLHARQITFTHPVTHAEVSVTAPVDWVQLK